MAGYQDQVAKGQQLPSLAEMVARMKEKRAAQRANPNPGDKPVDAVGGPQQVTIAGEAPITAQPVGGPSLPSADEMRMRMQQRQAAPGQTVGVTVGTPQMPPQYQMSVGQPQMPPQVTVGQPYNRQIATAPVAVDPRGERVKQLMAQGMSYQQAMQAVAGG